MKIENPDLWNVIGKKVLQSHDFPSIFMMNPRPEGFFTHVFDCNNIDIAIILSMENRKSCFISMRMGKRGGW